MWGRSQGAAGAPEPIAGGSERDRDHIDHLVEVGQIPRAAVEAAERLWSEHFRSGVMKPNGETVSVALTDLYHLLRDNRIWRKPERIERLLRNVFEIRTARNDRRNALSRWEEESHLLAGYAILTQGSHLVTIHLVDESELRRQGRKGDKQWP